MSVFLPQVSKAAPTANDARDRRWIYVPYDRLTDRAGPPHNTNPSECGIVMVESLEKGMPALSQPGKPQTVSWGGGRAQPAQLSS
jgi:hypothetical protein